MEEKLLSSQRIYNGRVVSLRVDNVELPSGEVTLREVVEHSGAVAILPLLDDGKLVMIRQFRHPIGETILEVPAGTLRLREDPEECARRELIEETGYSPQTLKKIFSCYLAPGYSTELIHIYLATDLFRVERRPEGNEFIKVIELSLGEALRKIEKGEIKDAKSICAVLWFSRASAS